MPRTSVDLVTDVGLVGGELTGAVDVTAALFDPTHGSNSAEDLCRFYGVRTVTMPSSCKLLISKQKATWFPKLTDPIAKPIHARDWVGDPGDWGSDNGTRLILDTVPADYVTGSSILTIMEWDNFTNGQLSFRMDAQAAKQMAAYKQSDYNSSGKLVGFAVNGVRSTGALNPNTAVSYLNFRSRNASGYGSAFCQEMIQGQGGTFWTEFDVQDGSFGSECIVFHGYTFSGGDAWLLNHVRSRRMWRGWGCFNGGRGEVHDCQTWDLHPPGGTTSNIEAGTDKTDSTGRTTAQGGTPGPILLYAPKSTNGGIYLNINNNYSNKVGNVQLIGGTSTNDGVCITMTGVMGNSAGAPSGGAPVGLYCSDAFFDTPDAEILHLQSGGVATDVRMTRCKYRPSTVKKIVPTTTPVPGGWDLTYSATAPNSPPDIAELTTPAAGATISGTSVSVSAQAHDPNDGTSVTVELRADGNQIGSGVFLTHTTGNTFTGTLNSTQLSNGSHDLRVRVTDTSNTWTASTKNTVTVNNGTDTTPPAVSAFSLTNGQTISETTNVSVTATDASGIASGYPILRLTDDQGTVTDIEMS